MLTERNGVEQSVQIEILDHQVVGEKDHQVGDEQRGEVDEDGHVHEGEHQTDAQRVLVGAHVDQDDDEQGGEQESQARQDRRDDGAFGRLLEYLLA